MEEGIRRWDQGDRKQAVELYHHALAIFPKNPWALRELGLDYIRYNFDPEELLNGQFDSYYELIREIDPHYKLAYYQGSITEDLRTAGLALDNKVLPSFNKLWNGEDVLVNMRELAEGYFEMGEYEFALYAYKFILFQTYDGGFD